MRTHKYGPSQPAHLFHKDPCFPSLLKCTRRCIAPKPVIKDPSIACMIEESATIAFTEFIETLTTPREAMQGYQQLRCEEFTRSYESRVIFSLVSCQNSVNVGQKV